MEKIREKILLASSTRIQQSPDDVKLFDRILVEQDCLVDWQRGRRLGAGIHGTSYLAYHRTDTAKALPCVVKIMVFGDDEATDQSSSFTEFVLEVNAHANAYKIMPDHVPCLYQAWSFEGKGYIAMDFIPAGAIPCVGLQRQYDHLVSIWNQLAAGGVLHGDFKSSNILYHNKQKRYYVGDWGVSICPGDLKHSLFKPALIYKIRKQLERRRAKKANTLFIPICEMMIKIVEKSDDIGQLVTRLVFYETLYRLHQCIASPSLQSQTFAQVNHAVMVWIRSELPESDVPMEYMNSPYFWHYFHKFVDFTRNIVWMMQLTLLERCIAAHYIRLAYQGTPLKVFELARRFPAVRYLSHDTVTKMINRLRV